MDLILRGGRVIDPGQGLDGVRDVGFANGKVAAIVTQTQIMLPRPVPAAPSKS